MVFLPVARQLKALCPYKGRMLLYLRNQLQNVINMDVTRAQVLAVSIMP